MIEVKRREKMLNGLAKWLSKYMNMYIERVTCIE